MKRNLMYAGAILGVVGSSIATFAYAISFLYIVFGFSTILNLINAEIPNEAYQITNDLLVALAIIIFIMLIISVFAIIFNAKSISISKSSHEEFMAKKSNVVAAITFNFITLAMVLIVAAILMIVDLTREKDRVSVNGNVVTSSANVKEETQKLEKTAPIEKNTVLGDKLAVLEKDLNTLKNLREKELISDEEYEKLRSERINQHINNI